MTTEQFPRRIVFHGLGALGAAAALAGCGSDDGGDSNIEGEPADSPSASRKPTGKKTNEGAAALATTNEIPVAGGIILTDQKIVITQPTAEEFRAFTAVCTHQGCTVTDVSDGEIHCACHGSVYDAATGENIGGPAPAPLAGIDIVVRKGEIFEA